jgi:hypothetical protein
VSEEYSAGFVSWRHVSYWPIADIPISLLLLHRCSEQINASATSLPSQSSADCIMHMCGYDFWKGQGMRRAAELLLSAELRRTHGQLSRKFLRNTLSPTKNIRETIVLRIITAAARSANTLGAE